MKLEIGKKYICRNAPDIEWVEVIAIDERARPNRDVFIIEKYKHGIFDLSSRYYDGRYNKEGESGWDLIAEYKEPRKFEFWVNVYPNGAQIFDTSREAKENTSLQRISCIKVTGVEGQWDD